MGWAVRRLGRLAQSPATCLPLTWAPALSWQVLPVIVFFSCVMSVLYYVGLMQWVILKVSSQRHGLCSPGHLLTGLILSQSDMLPERHAPRAEIFSQSPALRAWTFPESLDPRVYTLSNLLPTKPPFTESLVMIY